MNLDFGYFGRDQKDLDICTYVYTSIEIDTHGMKCLYGSKILLFCVISRAMDA